jgi:CHAT domain-containing protein
MLPPHKHIFLNFYFMNKLIIKIFFIQYLFILAFPIGLHGQSIQELYNLSEKVWHEGDFKKAYIYLNQMLLMKDSLTERNKVAIFNRLGMINNDLGKYDNAILYFKKAKDIFIKYYGEDYSILSLVYNNMAISYKMKSDYEKSLEYYSIALNKLKCSSLTMKEKLLEKSKIYLNIGNLYLETGDYKQAVLSLEKSLHLKLKYGFEGLENVYWYLAKTYENLREEDANKYYIKCITTFGENKKIKNIYNSALLFKDYATFLLKTNQRETALKYYIKSLQIHLHYYGLRHPYTANCYLSIGNYYYHNNELGKALNYCQKSLISNAKQFADTNLLCLPDFKDVILDLQIIKSLKMKSEILLLISNIVKNPKDKIGYLKACINGAEFSLKQIVKIRNGYLTKSSKLNITRDEKAFYFMASEASLKLYELLSDENFKKLAYMYIQKSKASLLNEEIIENKAFTAILPDSARRLKKEIETNIYSYKKLIYDENQKPDPNEEKINLWSDKLFKLNNEYEVLMLNIQQLFPDYKKLIEKSNVVGIESLQENLKADESIIEYSLSPLSESGERKLLIFVINKNFLNYFQTSLNSDFATIVDSVRGQMNKTGGMAADLQQYNDLNKKLYQLYQILLKPVEKYFSGTTLFIVPDEEIAYISFDALQKSYNEQKVINYASVPYLVYNYCFSYGYSSSLLFQTEPVSNKSEFVYAFAPDYDGEGLSNIRYQYGKLENTENEIKGIFKWFKGKALVGRKANEEFFKTISGEEGIFHFAMHASSEKTNPDFSFLAINRKDSTEEDGLFYNYEIAMINMKATMVVLSGCNTGDGLISSGEGLMSLSRNFILAGVPSIVNSLWEVQDETSVVIMGKFYEYLSKGFPKNIALHKAKLDYIQSVSPSMVNPYFWSGYVLIGNPAPVVKDNTSLYLAIGGILLLFSVFVFSRVRRLRKKHLKI